MRLAGLDYGEIAAASGSHVLFRAVVSECGFYEYSVSRDAACFMRVLSVSNICLCRRLWAARAGSAAG